MRLNLLRFSMISAVMISLGVCVLANATAKPHPLLKDSVLARIKGTTSTQNGIGRFDCTDNAAANSGGTLTTADACGKIPNSQLNTNNPLTCVNCITPSTHQSMWFSTRPGAVPVVYEKNVDCAKGFKNGPTKQFTDGQCAAGQNGYGKCTGPTSKGNAVCNGTLPVYKPQTPVTPITSPAPPPSGF